MSKKDKKEPYHELPDVSHKLLRILVQAKLIPTSAHQVYLTIRDRFNTKGAIERVCFEDSVGNARRAGLGKKQFNKIANQLVKLGLLQLNYRVFLNNAEGEFKVFSTYDDAFRFRANCEKAGGWIKTPAIVRQYTEVEKLPAPEELGLILIHPKSHIYSAPENNRSTGTKMPEGVEKKFPTPTTTPSIPQPHEGALNGTNTNGTKINDTKSMINSTNEEDEEARPSLREEPAASSSPSDNLIKLFTVLQKRAEKESKFKIPIQQLRTATKDQTTKDAIEDNLAIVLESGGTFEGWVNCEFDRMKKNVGKIYRSPKLEYFGNAKSLNEYLDQLQGQRLLQQMNPFSDYLILEELRQCLSIPPEDDLLLIQYQVLLRAYLNAKSLLEISETQKMLPAYAHFFELQSKSFVYVKIKHLSFTGKLSKNLLVLARRFAAESDDASLISFLKNKNLGQLISTAKNHLQSH